MSTELRPTKALPGNLTGNDSGQQTVDRAMTSAGALDTKSHPHDAFGPPLDPKILESIVQKFPKILVQSTGPFKFVPRNHELQMYLMEPYVYLLQVPGKDVRGKLIDSFDKWLKIPLDTLEIIKQIIAMLHNASLLIDDIEDNSKMRRGVPATHTIYGVAQTINCANYVYFLAMDLCYCLGNDAASKAFMEELLLLHRGQGQDITWRDHNSCPSEDDYKQMVKDKTGGLLRLAAKLMQAFSDYHRDLMPLVDSLGLFYQIRDDYLNLQSEQYMEHKDFCEDLTEGKFSFPIIHAILKNTADKRLLNILRQKTSDVAVKKHAVEYMTRMGSFEYTRGVVAQLKQQVLDEIHKLGGNPSLEAIIEFLAHL